MKLLDYERDNALHQKENTLNVVRCHLYSAAIVFLLEVESDQAQVTLPIALQILMVYIVVFVASILTNTISGLREDDL